MNDSMEGKGGCKGDKGDKGGKCSHRLSSNSSECGTVVFSNKIKNYFISKKNRKVSYHHLNVILVKRSIFEVKTKRQIIFPFSEITTKNN